MINCERNGILVRTIAIRNWSPHAVTKECLRNRPLDAVYFDQSLTLTPLVEMPRIKRDPRRHNFGWRYLRHYLPAAEHAP